MKIFQLISSLGNGGAEKFVVELSNELSNTNEVEILSLKQIDDWMIFPKLLNKKIKINSFNKKKGFNFKIYFALFKKIKNEKPDIIHFHLDSTIKYILPFILIFPRTKFVYTIHSDLNIDKKRIFNQLSKINFISKKIKLICISKTILEEFTKSFPIFNFYLIENGIKSLLRSENFFETKNEIDKLKKNKETKIFISIGRIDENKNQRLQLDAFEKIKKLNCILLVIGSTPFEYQNLLNSLISRKLNNVFFLGIKDNIADYLELSDSLVITSKNEGLPLVAIEALSIGIPIITSKAGGMQDIVVDNENGFICQNNTVEEFINKVELFMNLSLDTITKISFRNRLKYSGKYSIERCANEYLKIYN